jgi:hypothetical protein
MVDRIIAKMTIVKKSKVLNAVRYNMIIPRGGTKMGMGIDVFERLNKLPKTIEGPEMDLENLKLVVSVLDNGEQTPWAFV